MHRWLIGHEKVIWEKPRSEWPAKVTDEFLRSLSAPVWTPEQLQCSPRGQVMLMEGERSVFQFNTEKASRLSKRRREAWQSATDEQKRQIVRRAIGMKETKPVQFRKSNSIQAKGYIVEDIVLVRPDGVSLAAKAYIPNGDMTGHVLYLHGEGMSADATPVALVKQGKRVLAAELSGIGLTDVPRDKRTWGYGRFGLDNQEIFTAYLIGDSFVRMRVADTLAWAQQFSDDKIELIGVGEAAIPALHAAALAPDRFHRVKLERIIRSWSEVVATPEHYNQLVNAVHGVLTHYDIPAGADVSNSVSVNLQPK